MSLMVSVSGVRGLINETLTPTVAAEFAQAYGTLLEGGSVVLARDTRPSGEMFASAVAAGLLASGCQVTQLGVCMTPTVGRAIVDGKHAGGVIITASHNPPAWNGIKFLDQQGLAPDPALASQIAAVRDSRRFQAKKAGFKPIRSDLTAGERHVRAVVTAVEENLTGVRGLRVVLDSINGAGCRDGAALLTTFGCDVYHLNGEPTGEFAHTPEPIAENLTQLCDCVRREKAAVGFAQDPDADRLAIVDEQGTYIGEEYTLALAAWAVLMRRPGPVAANLSTSRLVDAVAERFGVKVVRTAVGEANVARGMVASECVIGGEGNGGVIDPRITLVRDSLSAMSLTLQLLSATGKSVRQLVAELPRLAMIKQKFECPRERIADAVERTAKSFAGEKVNRSDGTRVDFAEGWVHVRASNTEPIVRIIAEAADDKAANSLVARVRSAAGI
ncbi:MAG: phosphoglucosamine mutase [Planctomycetes bacterium]|nr:phosphoglucosamine mutase [Planctomycetota bacterium]